MQIIQMVIILKPAKFLFTNEASFYFLIPISSISVKIGHITILPGIMIEHPELHILLFNETKIRVIDSCPSLASSSVTPLHFIFCGHT